MRPVVIGLAGGVGAGKSAAASALRSLGCVISNADDEVARLLETSEIKSELSTWWGQEIVLADGRLDRRAVAERIFNSDEERARLEALLHPPVIQAHREAIEAAETDAIVIDAPLLFEAGVDALCDAVIFVDAERTLREARVRETRAWSPEELDRREKSQMPLEIKRERSHYIVRNDAGIAELEAQIRDVFAAIMLKQGRSRP